MDKCINMQLYPEIAPSFFLTSSFILFTLDIEKALTAIDNTLAQYHATQELEPHVNSGYYKLL